MKVLLVGSGSKYAIEKHYLRHMQNHDAIAEAQLFTAQDLFLAYYRKGFLYKIMYRLGLSKVLQRINQQLLDTVAVFKPDVVFVFKGMELLPSSLRWMRSRKIKLVNYNPDNPFVFSGRGSGNHNVTQSIGLYDLHFTYDDEIRRKIETSFTIPTRMLPFGYELTPELLEHCISQTEVERICFLGNPDQSRAYFINQLALHGVEIDVYGNGWSSYVKHDCIHAFDAVYDDEFWKALRRYRVQLNLMRIHNPHSHNMRSFEVPAVGGILLAPDTEDHRKFFTEGKEILLYRSLNDCIEKIRTLLNMSTIASQEIRNAAIERSVHSGYSYQNRSYYVVDEFQKLLHE